MGNEETDFGAGGAAVSARPALYRYGLAIALAALAAVLRLYCLPTLSAGFAFITFYPAVMFAGLYGGAGPGLLATALSSLIASFYWFKLGGEFPVTQPAHLYQAAFLLNCTLICWIIATTRQARLRASAAESQARLAARLSDGSAPPAEPAQLQSEGLFQVLVNGIPDCAVFMLDCDGRVVRWNRGAERLLGYRTEEILGQSLARFYPPTDAAAGEAARLLHEAEAHGQAATEGWRVRKDGSQFRAGAALTAWRDNSGQLRGFAHITRDLTERASQSGNANENRQSAEALRAQEERTRAAEEAALTLQVQLKEAQALTRQVQAAAAEERARTAESLRTSGVDTSRAIDMGRASEERARAAEELLQQAMLAADEERTRAAQAVQAAQTAEAERKQLSEALRASEARVRDAEEALRQAKAAVEEERNRAEWALRHARTATEGTTRVRVRRTTVISSKAGMPALDVSTPAVPAADSRASTRVELAAIEQPGAAVREQTEKRGGKNTKRVLIIEENWDEAEWLRALIEVGGHSVHIAHSGREGLRLARVHMPEFVVCSIALSHGMDGYAVASSLRAVSELKSACLVAVTAGEQQGDREPQKGAGFDHYLTKPVNPDLLGQLLAR